MSECVGREETALALLKQFVEDSKMGLWNSRTHHYPTYWSCTKCRENWNGNHEEGCYVKEAKDFLAQLEE